MGWIGGLSGMSSVPMGVSEIGVSFPDASFGEVRALVSSLF